MPGDVEHILGGEGEASQRARRHAIQRDMGVPTKGVIRIAHGYCGWCNVAGCRDTVLRPRLKA